MGAELKAHAIATFWASLFAAPVVGVGMWIFLSVLTILNGEPVEQAVVSILLMLIAALVMTFAALFYYLIGVFLFGGFAWFLLTRLKAANAWGASIGGAILAGAGTILLLGALVSRDSLPASICAVIGGAVGGLVYFRTRHGLWPCPAPPVRTETSDRS